MTNMQSPEGNLGGPVPAPVRDLLADAVREATGRDDAALDEQRSPMQLGIDSLMIMQINNRLRRALGVDVSNERFFDPDTTLAQLAGEVARQADPARLAALAAPAAPGAAVAEPARGGAPVDVTPAADPSPAPAPAAPLASPVGDAARTMLETLMQQQLQAFSELARQQLDAFERAGAVRQAAPGAQPAPVPAPLPAPPVASAQTPPPAVQPAAFRPTLASAPTASAGPATTAGTGPGAFVPYRAVTDAAGREAPIAATALATLTRDFCAQTPTTKGRTQADRAVFANNRNIAGLTPALKEMTYQVIAERAAGAHIWDLDGNRYVDLTQGFGSSLLGHSHPLLADAIRAQLERTYAVGPISNDAGEVARRICRLTGAERAAFYNSGTEAVMVAARLARTATGRSKVVCFEGAYHGMSDGMLALPDRTAAAPGDAMPMAPGVTEQMVADTLVLPYDDPASLSVIEQRAAEIAAVIVEPVQSRRPDLRPRAFLLRLRALTERIGAALIFDEVVTGFRAAPGGAQAWFGVRADLAAYGKVVGGGMPIGVVAGSARFMDGIDGGMWTFGDDSRPVKRNTYVAGTFCSHPLTMAAAKAMLTHLEAQGPALQRCLNARTRRLCARLNNVFADLRLPMHVVQFASLFRVVLPKAYEPFWYRLQVAGLYVWEGRNCLLSTAHDDADIEHIVAAVREAAQWLAESVDADAAARTAGCGVEEIPASAAQQVMYARARRPNGAEAYHVPALLVVDGPLDAERLESALTELCDRHEALRTAFVERDGELFQRIHPVADFALTVGEAIDEQDIDDLIKPLLQPFDLTLPGLLRCAVAPLGPERHALALNLHHLVADGVSAGLLVEELLALAAGEIRDASPTPYREYVAWEQAYLASPEAERDEAAWRERLAALPPRVELPQDMTAAGPRAFGCRRIGRDLTHPERLRSFARARGVTMNMLLQAIFQVWLASVSRREELFYGSPSAGRPAGRFDATIGLFIGVLVYRARVGAGTCFADLLDAVRSDTAALLKLQHLPFERLQRLLPDPGDGGTPFEVGINYDGQLGPFQSGSLRVTPGALDGRPGMSLACVLDLRDIGERLRLDIAHDPARYSRDAVAGWAALFDALAQALTEAPERPIGELIAGLAGDGAVTGLSHEAA